MATDRMTDAVHRPTDPVTWLDAHGDALYRFALARVRDAALAEDLVQDTLLAALRAHQSYAGEAAERTWLIAILKNKIIDHFRHSSREAPLPGEPDDEVIDALFRAPGSGHWVTMPGRWDEPETALEQTEFWRVFQECLDGLPERQARVFGLTEFDGLGTEELCKLLGVSTSNLWVLLHRARLRLRECLEQNWFGPTAEKG